MVNEVTRKTKRKSSGKPASAKAKTKPFKEKWDMMGADVAEAFEVKEMFAIRLTASDRAMLAEAARAEDRPMGYIVRRALLIWLKEHGYDRRK